MVYATETLAAGINMPARTTVISSVSKRRDDGHGLLKHNEMLQMAGRAGRRGYDTVGEFPTSVRLRQVVFGQGKGEVATYKEQRREAKRGGPSGSQDDYGMTIVQVRGE